MGASRVVAAGRDKAALEAVRAAGDARVAIVPLAGDVAANAASLREAAGGGADLALDIVGRAKSADSTLATLRALRRGGRLVLMGSVGEPVPLTVGEMLANDWSVCGNFMYPKDATARLVAMVASGILDLSTVRVAPFPLAELPAAIDARARGGGLVFPAGRMGGGRVGAPPLPDAAHSGDGLRLPMGTKTPSLTDMIVTSLSGARFLLEKSALPVTPVNWVIVKIASLIDFDERSDALFMAAIIRLTES